MNKGLSVYPEISDADFYKLVSTKKEFYDNRITNVDKKNCLQPQQQFLSNYINPLTQYNSILINEMTGLGKTLASISIAENFKNDYKILVIVKNKLLDLNFRNELILKCSNYSIENMESKTSITKDDILKYLNKQINKYYTFNTPHTFIKQNYSNIDNTVLIIDEIHNVVGGETYNVLIKLLKKSKNVKLILMSATPNYDNILNIFEITNLLNFNDSLPIRNNLVKHGLIYNTNPINTNLLNDRVSFITDKGKKELLSALRGKVSYLITDTMSFPTKRYIGTPISNIKGSIHIQRCNMSKFQTDIYKTTIPIGKSNTENYSVLFKDSTDSSMMVYPDSGYGPTGFTKNVYSVKNRRMNRSFLKKENLNKYSCKLSQLLDNLHKTDGLCFIYSNYVTNGGIEIVKYLLKENGYQTFSRNNKTGNGIVVINDIISDKRRNKIIELFNSDSNKNGEFIKIIIGGPLVSEGLTFKNIRQIHILDPHWNLSRIDQIIGRGVRYKSHSSLPLSKQNVDIFLYAAIPNDKNVLSIDLAKYQLAEKKDVAIKEVEYLLKTVAVDCFLNKKRNTLTHDNSRECQYTKCKYVCPWDNNNKTSDVKIDTSTYMFEQHAKYKMVYINNKIEELFTHGYIYDLNYIINWVKKDQGNIDERDIYITLNKLLGKTIIGPQKNNVTIVYIGNYYVANPENTKIRTMLFNKLYKKEVISKQIPTITKTIIKPSNKTTKTILNKSEGDKIVKLPLYGSFTKDDNNFKIIDNRNTTKITDKITDKRNINRGKTCVFYHKQELIDLYQFVTGKLPDKNYSKNKICELLYNNFKEHNMILKLS